MATGTAAVFKDARDVGWTAGSAAAADGLFDAIEAYFTFRADTMDRLDRVLAEDADVPGAWILKGCLSMLARSGAGLAAARQAHGRLAELSGEATARERRHTAALKHWTDGDPIGAQHLWDAILDEDPHDLLALRVQHFNAMFLGRPDNLRSSITRALADWDDAVPGAGFVYGMACMGLEETGDFARAERIGRRGAELEPDDLWSVHSVAHVMEAEGRLAEGLDWMERPDSFWNGRGPMRHHLLWHEALFLYETGACDRALDHYDTRLAPGEDAGYMEISNAASLLARLEAAGVDCGPRWQALAERTAPLQDARVLTFSDIHTALALARAGDRAGLERLERSVAAHAERGGPLDRDAAARIALPVIASLRADLQGDAARAADILTGARFEFPRMGGSNAQRELLDILLIDATGRAGRTARTRRLLREYLDQRPRSRPMHERLAALDAASPRAG